MVDPREFPEVVVLFGSQTGTAQDLAIRISRQARQRSFRSRVRCLDNFPIVDILSRDLVLFIASTTGEGEEPDNMKTFWRHIMRKSLPRCLENLRFAVIGLGDSSFQRYNVVAKKLFKRLLSLGGKALVPLILGDDQHTMGPDATVEPGLKEFWKTIVSEFSLPEMDLENAQKILLPPSCEVKIVKKEGEEKMTMSEAEFTNAEVGSKKGGCSVFEAVLKKNERQTGEDHFQDVRLLEFRIQDRDVDFKPGAVAVVKPQNLQENVQEFLELIKVARPDQFLQIIPKDQETSEIFSDLPRLCTFQHCASNYWDLNCIPKRSFFELFHHFSESEMEKEKMMEFCTMEGQDDLWEYTTRPRRMILEVLRDFPQTTPYVPLAYWFDLLSPIQPRYFSIASSPQLFPHEFHLLVAVVHYKTRLKAPRRGLCSTWMSRLKPGARISVRIRPSGFLLPPDSTPVVMVGPGTGCAPFRSLTQDRVSRNAGNNHLFFGSRNERQDFFFSQEWKSYVGQRLLNLNTAFSRDQPHKIYVQHRIKEQGDLLWNLLDRDKAFVFIAGNAKQMPLDVRTALQTIAEEKGQLSPTEAESFLKDLQNHRRLQVEVW